MSEVLGITIPIIPEIWMGTRSFDTGSTHVFRCHVCGRTTTVSQHMMRKINSLRPHNPEPIAGLYSLYPMTLKAMFVKNRIGMINEDIPIHVLVAGIILDMLELSINVKEIRKWLGCKCEYEDTTAQTIAGVTILLTINDDSAIRQWNSQSAFLLGRLAGKTETIEETWERITTLMKKWSANVADVHFNKLILESSPMAGPSHFEQLVGSPWKPTTSNTGPISLQYKAPW